MCFICSRIPSRRPHYVSLSCLIRPRLAVTVSRPFPVFDDLVECPQLEFFTVRLGVWALRKKPAEVKCPLITSNQGACCLPDLGHLAEVVFIRWLPVSHWGPVKVYPCSPQTGVGDTAPPGVRPHRWSGSREHLSTFSMSLSIQSSSYLRQCEGFIFYLRL